MEYCIVVENELHDLEAAVNDGIKDGWKPQGGVAVIHGKAYDGDAWTAFYQAMTRE